MTLLFAIVALVVAVLAVLQARRASRDVVRLTEMYWQLKYDHAELKAVVMPAAEPRPAPSTTFVPLGSVKRSQS